jgi:hypothetical protein
MSWKSLRLLFVLTAVLPLLSCSGLKGGSSGGGGTANVTISLYDTAPTGVNLLSFTLPISSISMVSSSGTTALTLVNTSVEATRLQTDSVLLVDAASVPAGTAFTSLKVTFGATSATANVFINTSTSTITWTTGSGGTCASGAVCSLPVGSQATISVPLNLTLSKNGSQWIGLNLNLNNAITTAGGLAVDFTQSGVLTAVTTPRTGLPSSAADTIEDFTGIVTAYTAGSSITVQNGISGQKLTATLTSSTIFDNAPTGADYPGCGTKTPQTCIQVGSTVSLDTILASSGLFTAAEVDVLDATNVPEVEGIIYPTSNGTSCPAGTCFAMLVADKIPAGNTVLGATTISFGTPMFLNVNGANLFAIDTKTLSPAPTAGFTGIGDLLTGQQVRVQVTNVTSAAGIISANAKNMMLRFSRLTGITSNVGPTSFTFAPPPYITAFPVPVADTYTSTVFDGATSVPTGTVSIRALYLDNSQLTFAVTKVRVP